MPKFGTLLNLGQFNFGKNLVINVDVLFISMVLFNLRLEYAVVFHKSSFEICLFTNIHKRKFQDLTHVWGEGVWYENEEILKWAPSRLLKSLT